MKKLNEFLFAPKILWCLILGMFIAAIFAITLPIDVAAFPCLFGAIIVLMFCKKTKAAIIKPTGTTNVAAIKTNEVVASPTEIVLKEFDYPAAIAVILGGLLIQLLVIFS